jgi:hypothetical protein
MTDGAGEIGHLMEVRARFDDPGKMQDAVDRLSLSGFDRADLSLPSDGRSLDEATPDAAAKPASTDTDAQQARTLGTSTAGAAAALAAAGVVIATGGAAAPAVVAAALAGGAAGGATFVATGATAGAEQGEREALAARHDLVLSVRTRNAAKQFQATEVLRAAGATNIETLSEETA